MEKPDEDSEEKSAEESKYVKFWKAFGKYIKMGLIEDAANRTRLAKLLRYSTSKSGDKEIGLEEYVANMKEDQKNIYYISGEDKESLMKSPSVRGHALCSSQRDGCLTFLCTCEHRLRSLSPRTSRSFS